MIRLILADDDVLVLQGLTAIVGSFEDLELVGTAENGTQALELCRRLKPDVAVLDIRMPGTNGIQVAKTLMAQHLAEPLLLTTFDEPELIVKALEAGVKGYVLKNSPVQRLHSAIVTVAEGGTVFSPDILDFIRSQVHASAAQDQVFLELTPRELDIVRLISQGLTNQQIAAQLFIANGTVRNHISIILDKTGLEHRTQIAVRYLMGTQG